MTTTLEIQPYQRVVAASGLSNLADGVRFVALPLLTLEVTRSPFFMTAVAAANMVPWLLFGLWAGAVTDRVDRSVLARRTALLRVGLLSSLGVLILVGAVPLPLLLAAAFVLGTSEVMADNVSGALIPLLIDDADLERANSRMVGAEILGNELIGPAFGGLLFATAASLPFFTNAGLLGLAFLFLSGLPLLQADRPAAAPTDRPKATEGVAAVLASPRLRVIAWSSALLAAIDGAWFALLAFLLVEELGMSYAMFGVFLAVGAVGGLLGAAAADRVPGLPLPGVSAGVFAAMAVPLLALSAFPSPAVVVAALVVTSGAFSMWNVFMVSARQRASTPQTLGRIGAAHRVVVVTAALLGTLGGGLVAELVSVRATLAVAGVALVLAAPVVMASFRRA